MIGVKTGLLQLIVHLDKASIKHPQEKKEEYKSVADTVKVREYKQEAFRYD